MHPPRGKPAVANRRLCRLARLLAVPIERAYRIHRKQLIET